ncbi:MAG TPA: bifunctional phosphoserine phosphatase/homoserine phosphotransferase ThrH [Spirochaetaceae bacterium]|nr:bifunctional phosphoserine phosphatase/homoserine phosphotransferase ThrH [Spirochaetaceae bacterium]
MVFVTCDLEGVFTPEIWIEVAERLGIEKLRITTREEKDYDKLMKMRIRTLKDNHVRFEDIGRIINSIDLLEGAGDFLNRLRKLCPVAVVSDTFSEFFNSGFAQKLNWPLIFCHDLVIRDGYIDDYRIRIQDSKKRTVQALHALSYEVFAFGDSYNDISMIKEADSGSLFRAPANIIAEYPEILATDEYDSLYSKIEDFVGKEKERNDGR